MITHLPPVTFPAACYHLNYAPRSGSEEGGKEHNHLFDTPEYTCRVFVTNMDAPIDALVWVRCSDHYQAQGIFQRLMDRLREIRGGENGFARG